MTTLLKKTVPLWLTLLPLFTYAHEGHGVYHEDDLRHYWYSGEHAIPVIILVVIFSIILIRIVQTIRKNKKTADIVIKNKK